MTDNQFRNALYFREKRVELKAQEDEIKKQLEPIKAQLAKLDEEESKLEATLIESMAKEGVKTKVFEGHSFTSSQKKYIKIVDNDKLLAVLGDKYIAPLKRIIGATYEEIRESLVKPAELDTKKAREYIDILTKVENVIDIEGTEVQVTEYLTIK